jgi:hypothetical protein
MINRILFLPPFQGPVHLAFSTGGERSESPANLCCPSGAEPDIMPLGAFTNGLALIATGIAELFCVSPSEAVDYPDGIRQTNDAERHYCLVWI